MPVPESSYSRRFGREESTFSTSYSRSSTSALGGGGGRSYSSYLNSKTSSTLPPRPPAYEYRKYSTTTDTPAVSSRFLSSSASRVGGGYRSSVSPARATASSIRRQLETSAPSIAERIKQMELGEAEEANNTAPSTRLSRFSTTMRSRDSPKSSTYTSSYTRDRSASRDFSSSGGLLSRGDSLKSSTENLRAYGSRSSPPTGGAMGSSTRRGSGGGLLRNGFGSRLSTIENSASSSATSFLTKCEADSNANDLQESTPKLCNGEASSKKEEKEGKQQQLPTKLVPLRKKTSPKVIFHTIQMEEPQRSSPSPEPVYTLTSRPSLDGTGPKIELKNVTKKKSLAPTVVETVSADFKVTLPKVKVSPIPLQQQDQVIAHNNTSITNNKSAQEDVEIIMSPKIKESMSKKDVKSSKESSPVTNNLVHETRASSPYSSVTPDKELSPVPPKFPIARKSSSTSKSPRETTPTPQEKEKSPCSPAPQDKLTNGEVENINTADVMGPHSSKYYHITGNGSIQRDYPNRNERYGLHGAPTASDSSDNDSDTLPSSASPNFGKPRANSKADPGGLDKAGLTGLRNIGNTCFMNAVLQCLSNTKSLLEYVLKGNYEVEINRSTSGMKGALMRAFGDLIRELWREQRVVDTSAFKDQIQKFAPRFIGYSQQDAQEFLRYLLEGMHEDVNRITIKPTPITTDIDDSLSDNEKAAESWRRYLRYESSKIVDMFVGQFKSTLKCTVCGHCSVTFDPFWDLSLPIPSRSSNIRLSQCFELLTKEETLDGDEKPTCAKCQCRRKCTKSLCIQKFPKILVVHLKRFSLAERFRGKLSTLVDYPLNGFDLTPFSAAKAQIPSYNLYGVANHSGSTYSGHYIASCKHPYSGEWHSYNDSRVSPISPHSVVTSEGYVLFYEQVGQSSLL